MVVATEAEAEIVKRSLVGICCEIGEEDGSFVIYATSFNEVELNLPFTWESTKWREVENRGFVCTIFKIR
jgi:hypothetical protein